MKDKPCVFISYSRKDGFDFARNLRQKLEMLGFSLWQDVISLEGGRDFWLQITEALDNIEFMVLVLTDGAMQSPIVRKEWRYARQQGVCVYPVKGEPFSQDIHKSLPRWMRDAQYYDFDIEEQWQKFVSDLHKSCETVRVPFMVEDKPDDFVERPEEFNQLLTLLLDPKREEPIAITAALRGAGGYGKTTLAKALCHDEAIQNAFDDGILWVTLGENPGDLTGRVEDLIYTLSGERPGFSGTQAAAARFAELLADRDVLLVIDDVWNSAHLTPFLQGGSRCSRLITTRNSDTLPAKAKGIDLDAMRPDEATSLLSFNLPKGESSGLQHLAQRLGEWPLLLKLVNATLRYRVHDLQQSFAEAIAYVNAALDECGLIAFDQDNATERHQAVAKTLEVSLQMLDEGGRQRYFELAIFPEDVNIPLTTLDKLWAAAGYKPIHTEKLCEKLHKLSLLLHFDLSKRTIHLHDVMRQYLVQKIGAALPKLHARFLDVHRSTTPMQTWATLPADEPYLWRHLAYHLHSSGQTETLRRLLFDYDWLQNKLVAYEVNALLTDYDFFPKDRELQLLQSALRLSINQLARDRQQLPSHLFGRLIGQNSLGIRSLLKQAKLKTKRPWLRPLMPTLTIAGGPLLRTLEGHSESVLMVVLTSDGKYALSTSSDGTLKVWDLVSGQALRTLKWPAVTSIAIMPDGNYAVLEESNQTLKVWDLASGQVQRTLKWHRDDIVTLSSDGKYVLSKSLASKDNTLKIWDVASGEVLQTFKGYRDWLSSVAFTPDGKYAVLGSSEGTLEVWDLTSGQVLRVLEGHRDSVQSVAITPDGKYAVSASLDKTLKVWDLTSGLSLRTLKGHRDGVNSVAITSDSKLVVSASRDYTLKVWDITSGKALQTLEGHRLSVESVTLTSDGKYAVSASYDGTLKIWDLDNDQVQQTLKGYRNSVLSVAITSDGKYAVSASSDKTIKVWDLASRQALRTLKGHRDWVNSIAITPDSKYAVSASSDKTLKIWDLASGQTLKTLKGHRDSVTSVAITTDGRHAVSASWDEMLKVWDLASGQVLQTLEGHSDWINCVVITPNGRHAVSASRDHTLKIWDLTSGLALRTLKEHHGSVRSVALTPDGKFMVSASDDKMLKVWGLTSAQALQTWKGHRDSVWNIVLMPNGKYAVSVSEDQTLKVWEFATGEAITTFQGESPMWCCAVALDGRTIVVGDYSGQVHFLLLEGLKA